MKIETLLVSAGCRMTAPRMAVLKALSLSSHHVSARELHKRVKAVDLASVYRTLNLFEELRLLNVEVVEKEKLYCLADTPHHHITCKKCGFAEKVECKHDLGKFKNFTNVSHSLTFTGLCAKCN